MFVFFGNGSGKYDVEVDDQVASFSGLFRVWQTTIGDASVSGGTDDLGKAKQNVVAFQGWHLHRASAQRFFERDFSSIVHINTITLEVFMWLVFDDENNVGWNCVVVLVAFSRKGDLSASLPSGLDVDCEHFVLFSLHSIRANNFAIDFHLFGASFEDFFKGHLQVVLDWRVLLLLLSGRIERVVPRWLKIHSVEALTSFTASAEIVHVEEHVEGAAIAEELREGLMRITMEGEFVSASAWSTFAHRHLTVESRFAILVVDVAFLFVGQHFVRFGD